ncbi:MAG: AIR synthase family protein [candidate division WOR-3 bacterium]
MMTKIKLPEIGKLDKEIFENIIFPRLGKKDSRVFVNPRHGVDAGVIDLGDKVMVVAEDPTFGMPVLMPHFGWGVVHICASDVAVMGVKPEFMTISLLLPLETETETLEFVWKQIHTECKKLNIAIVGGHTGVYPGISYPLNGGCTVWGFGKREELTPPSNAKIGDKVIITKGPAIEATGILARQAEKQLKSKLSKQVLEKAKKRFLEMTVVKDALIARRYANAMHDATEGGLLNGIFEIANASNTGVKIYEELIPIPEEISAVCNYFNIDPLTSISEGTLIVTASEQKADKLISTLKQQKIDAYVIGDITKSERTFIRKDGTKQVLKPVKIDPFWNAYFGTLK